MTGIGAGMMLNPSSEGHAQVPQVSSQPAAGFVAEDQTPTGKFMTAGEVKPIVEAIKPQWIAVRLWDGAGSALFHQPSVMALRHPPDKLCGEWR